MPQINIVPAHDPRVMCHFTVPRKGKTDLTFSVPRAEFIPEDRTRVFDEWLADRMKPIEQTDDNALPVLDDDGEPALIKRDPITDREVALKMLESAGLAEKKLAQIADLTNGEVIQIYEAWMKASKVDVGESGASENS